jgi:rSAM/selenodomain-associated transferase 1
MVHPLANSALLFSASKSRESTASVSPRSKRVQRSLMESSKENPAHSPDRGRTLVVMAKAPRLGLVKTRLAQSLPVEAVTELYRCLLDDTMMLARSLRTVDVAIMCPASDVEELTRLAHGAVVVAQKGEGLAAGLTSVFAHFTAPGRQRVVAFNSDSPHLPASVLESAFEALTGHDLVVGPTHDGGYYLVGAKTAHPTLFDGDGMGTKSALEALLARAHGKQLSIASTESFYDIDVESDLARLAEELRLTPARAPRTAAWLKHWGRTLAQLRTAMGNL